MTRIEKKIFKYLKQKDKKDNITTITVNYNLSVIIRKSINFKSNNYNGMGILTKECYLGDLKIKNKNYKLNCNFLLEDEIYFS